MIYGPEDLAKFEKATHCHICEGTINKTTKIDHIAKIHKWLRIKRLPNRVPSLKEVEGKKYSSNMNIPEKQNPEAKSKLREYLKHNNDIVMRDYCHWTGGFRGAAHQYCNLMYRKTCNIPCFLQKFTGYVFTPYFQEHIFTGKDSNNCG